MTDTNSLNEHLECALRDAYNEIALLKTTIKGFEAALELANEKASKAISSGYPDHDLNLASQLYAAKQVIEDRDRTIQDMQVLLQDVRSMHALAQAEIGDQHRKIEILKDNLDRARSEHLEQLRAIVQMLKPLATHEDKGTLYLSHFGKAAMVYMIQRVIYANIEKLDPILKSYDNDF